MAIVFRLVRAMIRAGRVHACEEGFVVQRISLRVVASAASCVALFHGHFCVQIYTAAEESGISHVTCWLMLGS